MIVELIRKLRIIFFFRDMPYTITNPVKIKLSLQPSHKNITTGQESLPEKSFIPEPATCNPQSGTLLPVYATLRIIPHTFPLRQREVNRLISGNIIWL
ncbi:MAG: hypothetical protein GXP46_00260 [Deferribacteres bacterium]|nr:hypothetical protein [Deferribacteres bacterium]